MHSTDLKTQLANETKAKRQLVELATDQLMNGVSSFQNQLSESAKNYRDDLRDEMKKARESWEELARAERQRWEEATAAERKRLEEATTAERRRWEESSRRQAAELEQTKRRLWLWGPISLLVVVLASVALTVVGTTYTVGRSSSQAFSALQESEAAKLASTVAELERAKAQLAATQAKTTAAETRLDAINKQIADEQQRLKEAERRQALLTTYDGTKPGTIFVQIAPDAKAFVHQGKTLIQAETNQTK